MNTKAQDTSAMMAREGLAALDGQKAVNAAYSILCDHPGITPEMLEDLGNRLSREGHMRARE